MKKLSKNPYITGFIRGLATATFINITFGAIVQTLAYFGIIKPYDLTSGMILIIVVSIYCIAFYYFLFYIARAESKRNEEKLRTEIEKLRGS